MTFKSNEADLGGVIYFTDNSVVSFKECTFKVNISNSDLQQFYGTYISTNKSLIPVFIGNRATQGGAIYVTNESILQLSEASLVTFMCNNAKDIGGAIICQNNSNMIFEKKSHAVFTNNEAESLYLKDKSVFTCKGDVIEFTNNKSP